MPFAAGDRWSDEDDQALLSMRAEGKTRRYMADVLGRSRGAVCLRLHKHYRDLPHLRPVRDVVAPPPSGRVHLSKTSETIPDWYEAGWRLVGFEGASCIFGWPFATSPRWPNLSVMP